MTDNAPIVVFPQPTIKEQLVAASIAVGSTIVLFIAFLGFGAIATRVENWKERRKAKKILKARQTIKESETL